MTSLSRAAIAALALAFAPSVASCQSTREKPLLPRSQTWAELRTVRRAVTVKLPGEADRPPYPRERLVDGEAVHVGSGGLAWLRKDGGATLLVRGEADVVVHPETVEVNAGRAFIDTPSSTTTELKTPSGPLYLANVRASIDVSKDTTEVYVLAGEVRGKGATRAGAGEKLVIKTGAEKATITPALTWDDWTGGLATTDRTAAPSPFGVGTVGARSPGNTGSPRFPLAIQRLDVRVTIEQDFAITEVDELFFNPSSETVEGIYRFRTPDGATMHRFGVDRDGAIKWGRVKEKQAAAAQYQANVYQGSTEDPALLEWDAPGVYRARLYPIGPGETRRVVVRYAEWLGRTGARGERRLYVYPMAAEGAESSLPHIEELYATIDLGRAGARDVRVGMSGVRDGDTLVIREQDLVPRADLAVELFDEGSSGKGFTAPHTVDDEVLPPSERAEARRRAKTEPNYIIVPVRDEPEAAAATGGLDLAIVVDTSAATDPAALAIARAATAAILTHLGKDDRAAVWAGDTSLRPILAGVDQPAALSEDQRRAMLTALARAPRGGATDLGAMLSQAAAKLDPTRRGAVVYIGDGAPTVGELGLSDLRDRLAKLPRPVRFFGLGVGDNANMGILKGLSRGAIAERIGDQNAAARAALRLFEVAERPARLGATVDLGPSVERVFPRDLGALVADESIFVVGRIAGAPPNEMTIKSAGGAVRKVPLRVTAIDDRGDLRRRWAEGRLFQMMDESTGPAALVDLGSRYGIITPYTSLYVPTKNEMTSEERAELAKAREDKRRRRTSDHERNARSNRGKNRPFKAVSGEGTEDEEKEVNEIAAQASEQRRRAKAEDVADNKEGGTGTRAKGEEGSMGRPASRASSSMRYGARGPAAAEPPMGAAAVGGFDKSKADNAPAADPVAAATAVAAAAPPPPPQAPMASAPGVVTLTPSKPMFKPPPREEAKPEAPADMPAQQLDGRLGGRHRPKPDADKDAIADRLDQQNGQGLDRGLVDGVSDGDVAGNTRNMWGGDIGESFGAGGLGLSGIGEGGGGRGEGIGLGNIGGQGQGFGSGHGRFEAKVTRDANQALKQGDRSQTERLAKLAQGFQDGAALAGKTAPVNTFFTQVDVPRIAIRCSSASWAPLEERVLLWRERLGRVTGNASGVAHVYRRALAICEAPTFRERSRLLSLLLDAMPTVNGKVALWREMFNDFGVADMLYRSILARVRTPNERRQLNAALGLRFMDPGLLAKALKDLKTPEERVKKLRALVLEWPDDFSLALTLLDALEDAGDEGGARELSQKLRARPDADARLRTAVGELYLRLSARAKTPAQKDADEREALRAFGEIVELSTEDPVARRRLGDLLRAHGYFAEAARHYETLKKLAPDDASVPLLLSAASAGQDKLEEAVKQTEAPGASSAPDIDQGPGRAAKVLASYYLATGFLKANAAHRDDEAKRLGARLGRVLAGDAASSRAALRGARVVLAWSHPEFHPTLWTNALGAMMPASEGDVTLGIIAATLPERDGAGIEVRLDKDEIEHAARLGAKAEIVVIFEDGKRVARRTLTYKRGDPPVISLSFKNLSEEQP